MKKELFKVQSVISTAALLTVLSMSAFAQEVDFNKTGTLDWDQTLEIQKQVKERNSVKRDKVKPISSIKSIGIKELEVDSEIKGDILRPKVKAISSIKSAGIKELDVDSEIKGDILRPKVKAISSLKSAGIKELEIDTEIKGDTLVKDDNTETTSISDNEKEEGILSREEALERYICKKDSQFKALEEKFTSFEKTITESTLAMQNAIMKIGMMNQNQNPYQVYTVPSLTDQYSHMYPMMMMQSMQNQMMMQNLNYNYNQSMNTMMMSTMMNYQRPSMGQREDAYTGSMNNLSNIHETYNPNRTMAVVKGFEGQTQPNMNYNPSSQTSFNFDELLKATATETKIPTDKAVETTIDSASEAEMQADLDALNTDGMNVKS